MNKASRAAAVMTAAMMAAACIGGCAAGTPSAGGPADDMTGSHTSSYVDSTRSSGGSGTGGPGQASKAVTGDGNVKAFGAAGIGYLALPTDWETYGKDRPADSDEIATFYAPTNADTSTMARMSDYISVWHSASSDLGDIVAQWRASGLPESELDAQPCSFGDRSGYVSYVESASRDGNYTATLLVELAEGDPMRTGDGDAVSFVIKGTRDVVGELLPYALSWAPTKEAASLDTGRSLAPQVASALSAYEEKLSAQTSSSGSSEPGRWAVDPLGTHEYVDGHWVEKG